MMFMARSSTALFPCSRCAPTIQSSSTPGRSTSGRPGGDSALGVIALHENNILDRKLAELSETEKKELDKRYSSLTLEPRKLKMIDRFVADSRSVALNHTAGLSTPQQVQMALFSLFSLMDTAGNYKAAMKRLCRTRHDTLYRSMGLMVEHDPNSSDYYTELDLEPIGEELYGRGFTDWLLKNITIGEMLLRIANEAGIVLMPGSGFGDTHPSVRVSLANLNEYNYAAIGTAVRKLLDEYHEKYSEVHDVKGWISGWEVDPTDTP
jgi:aspartate 4-decarboxylase